MATGKSIFSVKVTHFSKIELLEEEEFKSETAHKYLQTHRKIHHCNKMKSKLNFHKNGLKFVPSAMFSGVKAEFYDFIQIHRFFVFTIEPLVLILCVVVNNHRYVSITRFKTEKDLNRVCDEIQRVKGGGTDVTGQIQVNDVDHNKITASISSSSLSSKGSHVQKEIIEESLTMEHEKQRYREPMKWTIQNEHDHDECRKRNSDGACDEWEVSETYIEYDPIKGPRVVKEGEGPIYMFSAHQRHPHYQSVFTCESSSDNRSVSSSSSSRSSMSKRNRDYYPSGTGGRKLSRQWAPETAPIYHVSPIMASTTAEAPLYQATTTPVFATATMGAPPHRVSVVEDQVVPLDRRAISTSKIPSEVMHLPEYHRYSLVDQNGLADREFSHAPNSTYNSKSTGGSQNEISFTYTA